VPTETYSFSVGISLHSTTGANNEDKLSYVYNRTTT